jgi:hypothetical protein
MSLRIGMCMPVGMQHYQRNDIRDWVFDVIALVLMEQV